jgi:trans-aconitate methyltransferase
MGIGSVIRRLFGRHEHALSELYRSIYVDLDAYADQIVRWVPNPRFILEVGCGEGAVTERLAYRYPAADITAIDITPRVGRLFRGARNRVTFAQITVQDIAASRPGAFDLAIISDVIHHVPETLRIEILEATRRAVASDGAVVLKDWERTASPIHWLVHGSDRWITGDRVRYLRKDQADAMMTQVFGRQSVIAEARVGPWKNNFAMLARV